MARLVILTLGLLAPLALCEREMDSAHLVDCGPDFCDDEYYKCFTGYHYDHEVGEVDVKIDKFNHKVNFEFYEEHCREFKQIKLLITLPFSPHEPFPPHLLEEGGPEAAEVLSSHNIPDYLICHVPCGELEVTCELPEGWHCGDGILVAVWITLKDDTGAQCFNPHAPIVPQCDEHDDPFYFQYRFFRYECDHDDCDGGY